MGQRKLHTHSSSMRYHPVREKGEKEGLSTPHLIECIFVSCFTTKVVVAGTWKRR